MGDVFNAAFKRAAVIGAILAAIAALTSHQQGLDWDASLTGAAIIFLTTLLTRGLGEGGYDTNRANNGDANAGDVPVASAKLTVTKTA